eukprot:gene19356-biopygen31077
MPVSVSLEKAVYQQKIKAVRRPMAFPTETWEKWSEERETEAALRAVAGVRLPWEQAHKQKDVEELWKQFNRAAETYLVERSGDALGGRSRRHQDRGRDKAPEERYVAAHQCGQGNGAQTVCQRRLLRLIRQFEELERQIIRHRLSEDGDPDRLKNTWRSIRAGGRAVLPGQPWHAVWAQADPPGNAERRAVLDKLRGVSVSVAQEERAGRVALWKEELRNSFLLKPGKVFDICKGTRRSEVSMMKRTDGTFTGDVLEMDKLLRDAWCKIFRLYPDEQHPEPPWHPFAQRFKNYIPNNPMEVTDITAQQLRDVLKRMGKHQAAGMEGWRPAELKKLPVPLLELLAQMFNVVEETGAWPAALQRSLITLIPKGEGAEPLRMRPISVMSSVYRLWAGVRLRGMIAWQEKWAAKGQRGYRPGQGVEDVYWEIALRMEEAVLKGLPFGGLPYDSEKAFDRIPQQILMTLMESLGLHQRISAPLRTMYKGLRRRFRVTGAAVGQEFSATNGILQGCPVSVICLNALIAVWAKAVESESPGVNTL